MKKLIFIISFLVLALILSFTPACDRAAIDSDKAASVIYDAFELEEGDELEIIEFSLESPETAIAEFRLNGNQLSSRIKKTDAGWLLSEIQNKEYEWVPVEYFLKIKGNIIDETGKAFANLRVTLCEIVSEEGELKVIFKVSEGLISNPYTKTDSEGNFTIIADRRFWEGSGMFTLEFFYEGRKAYLLDQNDIPICIEVDKNTKKVDLGEIRARY